MSIAFCILGAAGRMGQAVIACSSEFPDLRLVGAVEAAADEHLGCDAGELARTGHLGVPITCDLDAGLAEAAVAIDFSHPLATAGHVEQCARRGVALLIGTTGQAAAGHARQFSDALAAASTRIAVLAASNTSIGVAVLAELVRRAAAALPADFDIEIVEAHHRHKLDAPSGTALTLGRAAAEGRSQTFDDVAVAARIAAGPRRQGEIGFASIRAGDVVGEHTVLFAGAGERLTLGHQATDRAIFARGALRAAAWLPRQAPGSYSMRDVLGL